MNGPKRRSRRLRRPTKIYQVIAVGAHPDDVEVGCGGVLCRLHDLGYRCGIIYLTEGEMGTGGNRTIRRREAEEAARIMGADILARFDWGDARLVDIYSHRVQVARLIRRFKPRIIFAPHWDGSTGRRQSHPDHLAAGRIAMNAANLASLVKLGGPHEVHRVPAIYHFFMPTGVNSSFVVDITPQYDRWMAALSAHRSQFLNPRKSRDYLWTLETLARAFGQRIGVRYGQGFVSAEPLRIDDPMVLVQTEPEM